MPITYDVFNTYDITGSRKGLQINLDGPIPIEESFTYKATRVNPVLVAITDLSGETLEYVLAPDISVEITPFDD